VRGVLEAIARIESGEFRSGAWQPDHVSQYVLGCLRPPMRQADRAIDWMREKTAMIVRKIRAADSAPGVLGTLLGKSGFLYGAHQEERLQGSPGQVLARRDGAICIGTVDGAVWISHLKAKDEAETQEVICRFAQAGVGCELCDVELCPVAGIKLPATQVLGPLLCGVPEAPLPIDAPADYRTFREIVYTEEDEVGYLVRFLQWSDEHVPVLSPPRRVSACPLAPDTGHRSARWRRFLVERHPSQCDRGERRSGRRILAEH
jgi:putative two-component system hydrogenase maturation factor HypX/HoxX